MLSTLRLPSLYVPCPERKLRSLISKQERVESDVIIESAKSMLGTDYKPLISLVHVTEYLVPTWWEYWKGVQLVWALKFPKTHDIFSYLSMPVANRCTHSSCHHAFYSLLWTLALWNCEYD